VKGLSGMNWLRFFVNFAYTQSENDKDYVTVGQIHKCSKMPRTTIYRYIDRLIDEGLIYRSAYGRYRVVRSAKTMAIGHVVLTPLDMVAFWNVKLGFAGKKSA
jgi:DNA-binding IclR family transcriptional regulator